MGNWWSSASFSPEKEAALNKLVTQQAKTIRRLESRIAELEDNNKINAESNNKVVGESTHRTFVRRDIILSWVDKKLEDPEYNITMLPDVIERQLKTQVIELMLETMDFIIENTYTVLPGGHGIFHDIRPLGLSSTSTSSHD